MDKILEISDLKVNFSTYAGVVQAVRGVNLYLEKGEAVAIVGESGCGKSVTAQSIMRLIPEPPGKIVAGRLLFNGRDLLKLSEKEMEKVRGREIGMIFQDPMTSLNPTMTTGRQIAEVLVKHQSLSGKTINKRCIELLKLVGIPNPEKRADQYPHEFSGGMRQRAMIAMALACNPQLLIADEPTTSLDVTIQAQIMELMKELQFKLSTSIILITHDLGIVAGLCSRILVMYAGKIVEEGTADALFHNPSHPYTRGLLKSFPRLDSVKKEELTPIAGRPPDLLAPPRGCAFWPRCDRAMQICAREEPPSMEISTGHRANCWMHYDGLKEVSL